MRHHFLEIKIIRYTRLGYTDYQTDVEFAMSVTKEQVQSAIKQYIDPYLEKDLVTAGVVKDIAIDGGNVKVKIVLGFPAFGYVDKLSADLKEKIEAVDGVSLSRGQCFLGDRQPYGAGWHEPAGRHQECDRGGLG